MNAGTQRAAARPTGADGQDPAPGRAPSGPPASTPPRLSVMWRAAWLGWKVESNWADPFVFAIYSILKPVSSSLTVIIMYWVITGGTTHGELFAFAYLGSAFHGFFQNILAGTTTVVIEDREFFETLHYVYISPASFLSYLVGRSSIRFLVTSFSVCTVLYQ